MRMKEVAKMVAGSMVIYVVMAACADGPHGAATSGAGSGNVAASGMIQGNTGSDASSAGATVNDASASKDTGGSPNPLDALTDPVPVAKADDYKSGARLKAKRSIGADGSSAFAGMHDSQLNVDCSLLPAADGASRYLPASGATFGSTFSDSGCTQPIVFSTTACPTPPQYATQYQRVPGTCLGFVYHVYPVAGAFTGQVYTGAPNNCIAVSSAPDAGSSANSLAMTYSSYTFYSLGAEIPPSQFVQATIQTDP